jgi:transposase InsO family protein
MQWIRLQPLPRLPLPYNEQKQTALFQSQLVHFRTKAKLREDQHSAARPNEVWAMDFLHDPFSRFSPVLDACFSYRAEDVVATLERVCSEIGYPSTIRVDQGTEFVSRDLDIWAYMRGVTLDFSRPGEPIDNCYVESFNGRFREEVSTRIGSCRSRTSGPRSKRGGSTTTRADLSALGQMTPFEFAARTVACDGSQAGRLSA